MLKERKAFTMMELIFVIVIIGILSAVAVPKFAATRDSAVFAKSKTTLAAVRNSISTERQKRILRGDFTPINDLDADPVGGRIFTTFNDSPAPFNRPAAQRRVLEYNVQSGFNDGQWQKNGLVYTAYFKNGRGCAFALRANRLAGIGGVGGMSAARCQEIFEN